VNCGVKSWKQQRSCRGTLHDDDDDDDDDKRCQIPHQEQLTAEQTDKSNKKRDTNSRRT